MAGPETWRGCDSFGKFQPDRTIDVDSTQRFDAAADQTHRWFGIAIAERIGPAARSETLAQALRAPMESAAGNKAFGV